jgi:hypothetical protein
VHEYTLPKFGPVNCVLIELGRGELGVISPAPRLNASGFAELDRRGRLTAIIVPHSGHQEGIVRWQARYPRAACYTPLAALSQIRQPGMRPLLPLGEWRAGPHIECREVASARQGGTLLRVRSNGRSVVYTDEIVIHLAALPAGTLTGALFWLSRSAPGLRINRVYTRWLCNDPAAVAADVYQVLDDRSAVVPAHGGVLSELDAGKRVKTLLGELSK